MKALVVPPGEGRFISVGSTGAGIMLKASSAETGGLCSVWEGHVEPGAVGAGPHFHREHDEMFFVLNGEIVLSIGEEAYTGRPGTFALVPRGTIHSFHNAASQSASLLVMHHPGGFERYLEEVQPLAARHGSSEEREALAAQFDMFPPPVPWTPS